MYEKKLRQEKGKKIPEVKKRRVPPAERAMKELEKEAARLEKARKKALKEVISTRLAILHPELSSNLFYCFQDLKPHGLFLLKCSWPSKARL